MNTRSKMVAGLVILLVTVAAALLYAWKGNGPTDEAQIASALRESTQASHDGRANGVLDLLSRRLQLNGSPVDSDTASLSRYIRNQKPTVVVADPHALVTGDEARIVSPITISVNVLGQSIERKLNSVTLIFRRESFREWGIFPRSRWRLSEVQTSADLEQGWSQ